MNGLISAICSSIIAIANLGGEGLTTPFRRIIFGLGISDVLQSLSFVFGPMMVPKKITLSPDRNRIYHNTLSCRTNGFILQASMLAVVMYVFHLCLYYLCKLKYRMTDDSFKYKIERKMHALIVVISLSTGTAGLALDFFHTHPLYLSFCSIAIWGNNTEEHMRRVKKHRVYFTVIEQVIPGTFLFMIIVALGLLCHHAYVLNRNIKREQYLRAPTTSRQRTTVDEGGDKTPASKDEKHEDLDHSNEENETPQDRLQNLSKLYVRENMIQAVLYVIILLLTYSFYAATAIYYRHELDATAIFFLPLGGFLNILVYTRPMVAGLRRTHPEFSRIYGFWLVLRAGGKIPDDDDLSLSCCPGCCSPSSGYESDGESRHTTSFWSKLSRLEF